MLIYFIYLWCCSTLSLPLQRKSVIGSLINLIYHLVSKQQITTILSEHLTS